MNCKRCHRPLIEEKRHWKSFCDHTCREQFALQGPMPKPKSAPYVHPSVSGKDE